MTPFRQPGKVEHLEINGKAVYIVESHQDVLLPWAELSGYGKTPLEIVTLDHHNDLHAAFGVSASKTVSRERRSEGEIFDIAASTVRSYAQRPLSRGVVEEALSHLWNDEHIDFALRVGIAQRVFVSSHLVYQRPPRGAVVYSPPVSSGVPEPQDEMLCERARFDRVVESAYLREAMNHWGIEEGALREPWVLDIDLDYFHTRRSINPANCSVILQLARAATAVTVALERGCVSSLAHPKDPVTVEEVRSAVCAWVELANANGP